MTILLAAVSIIVVFLALIGWGVWKILRHTSFVASIVARNVADQDEVEADAEPIAHEPVSQEANEDEGTRPIGFGARLRERN